MAVHQEHQEHQTFAHEGTDRELDLVSYERGPSRRAGHVRTCRTEGFARPCRTTPVDHSVYINYDQRMSETTTIRISRETHARVSRLATERHETIDETVSRAIRALRQDAMARDLATELTDDETTWLDADAG